MDWRKDIIRNNVHITHINKRSAVRSVGSYMQPLQRNIYKLTTEIEKNKRRSN